MALNLLEICRNRIKLRNLFYPLFSFPTKEENIKTKYTGSAEKNGVLFKILKSYQAWCQIKALFLFFPVMSLDMRFGLKLTEVCKELYLYPYFGSLQTKVMSHSISPLVVFLVFGHP